MNKDRDTPNSPDQPSRTDRKEGDLVAAMIEKLRGINLPPHQLRELGLEKDWNQKVAPKFVERVVSTAEKYKGVLKELSKR